MGMMGQAIEQSRGQLPIADTLTHSEKARLVVMIVERRS
jgi:hypothetical protein